MPRGWVVLIAWPDGPEQFVAVGRRPAVFFDLGRGVEPDTRQTDELLDMQTDEFGRHLFELLEPTVEALGYDLVRVRYMGGRTRSTLQIMAERPDGTMDVEDCAQLSRAVSALLDVEDPIQGEYELEVSSPGIDRPLTRRRDFERFAGYDAKIELARPRDGRRRFKGRLKGVKDEDLLLEVSGQGPEPVIERLGLSEISDAKLILTEELIRASLKAEAERNKREPTKTPTEHT